MAERVAWSYDSPNAAFQPIAGWLSFYARGPLECWVGEERVQPQVGAGAVWEEWAGVLCEKGRV